MKEDFVGTGSPPKLPKFIVVGIGQDIESESGHNRKVIEALKARQAAAAPQVTKA
jgi:hypothetical protein